MLNKCSIVTDFGCRTGCEYCIWRKHSLYNEGRENFAKNIFSEKYWSKIKFLFENSKKLDITGGGDPFCDFKSNMSTLFYDRLSREIEKHDTLISIHTSILTNVFNFMDQYVWHAGEFSFFASSQMQEALISIDNNVKKRVVVVADTQFFDDIFKNKEQFLSAFRIYTDNNIEISIRQSVDNFDKIGKVQFSKVKIHKYDNALTEN